MSGQPIYEFGGSGRVLHMALANGFPPLTYTPLLQPLTARYRVVSLPPRALWPAPGAAPTEPGSWHELKADLLAGVEQYGLDDVIAVGHSFGAVISMLAAIEQPQRFRALVMLDPAMPPQPAMEMMRAARAQGMMPRIPLVQQALARGHRFTDEQAAFTYWRGKPLFKDWTDDALWLYTRAMTRPADDGDGLQLSWPREWEAYYYMSMYTDSWDDLPRVRGLLPTLVLAGDASDAFQPESAALARELLPEATHVTISGGHLFPHSAPDATRAALETWLAENGL